MTVKIKGFNEFKKRLKQMEKGAKELEGNNRVSLLDLFTSSFMKKHTQYVSFEDFLSAGGFEVNSQEDFEAIPDEDMDAHVAKTTDFSSWEEMLSTAVQYYAAKKLGF